MQKRWVRLLALTLALLMGLTFVLSALWSVVARAAEPEGAAAMAPPEVGAEAYAVMDAATGQVLAAKNADSLYFPASITKIMTLGLTLENQDLDSQGDTLVPVSQAAVDALIPRATMIALQPGEEAPLRDLLYATQIESANDAANVLGEYVAGSMFMFATMMNDKARELGLQRSFFVNPSGQPDPDHAVTAREMADITRWALTVPHFREIFSATEYQMAPTNAQGWGRSFHNSNLMLQPGSAWYCEGVTGSKSGYTDDARYTLVTTVARGGTELICVVLHCPTNTEKYNSTKQLIDYCFANFHREAYDTGQAQSFAVPVYGGGEKPLGEITVQGGGQVEFMLHNSQDLSALSVEFEVPERYVIGQAFAPVARVRLDAGGAQADGLVAEIPLTWTGLEQLLAENTGTRPGAGAAYSLPQRQRAGVWVAIGIPAAILLLVLARALVGLVRHRRAWAAEAAQQPVSIAPRPPTVIEPRAGPLRPPTVIEPRSGPQRSGRAPVLRVVRGGGPPPRRAGQARG